MAIYQSMQRVRFSSTDDYEKFKIVFADVRHHLKSLPGFLHLTWWTHPQDPTWHNEVSFWTSYEALNDWHMNTYHKRNPLIVVFQTAKLWRGMRFIKVCKGFGSRARTVARDRSSAG